MSTHADLLAKLATLGLGPLGPGPVDDEPRIGSGGPVNAFADIVAATRAKTVIEVGSWEGRSALLWGNSLSARTEDWLLICLDTWLGSVEMWERDSGTWSREQLRLTDGYPAIHATFASNVRRAGYEKHTISLPLDSAQGLELLARHGVFADVIYVDAAHDFANALRDIRQAQRLTDPLNSRALVVCDDFMTAWPGVREAIFAGATETSARILTKDSQAALVPRGADGLVEELVALGWHEVVPVADDTGHESDIGTGSGAHHVARLTRELRDRYEVETVLRARLNHMRSELTALKSERREARQRQQQRRRQVRKRGEHDAPPVRELREQLAQTRAELDRVTSTLSWRVTAGLRKLRSLFSRSERT